MVANTTHNDMNMSVMIASSQASVRLNIQRTLQHAKHEILTARNGREAIAKDKDNMTNLIIADTCLPDMPIEEMLTQIREYRRMMKDVVENEYVPVILIASATEKIDDTKLKKLGVLARLNKPLNLKLISGCVNKILSGELKLEKDKMTNLYILDPEKRALEYFSKMLKADDLDIHTLRDVFDLYSCINGSKNVDLLIAEVMISDDPMAFLAEVKERSPDTQILVCTALHDEQLHQKFLDMGIVKVLTKPVNPVHMRAAVRQLVGKLNEGR